MWTLFAKTLIIILVSAKVPNCQVESNLVDPYDLGQEKALISTRKVFVHSKTIFLKSATLEAALRKHTEFQQMGFVITKDWRDADVMIEIERASFTTEFPYSIIEPRTRLVIGSGKVNSIGGTVAGKISKGFIKQMKSMSATPTK